MKTHIISVVMFLLSVTFIVIGLIEGQNESVLSKAVRICMECIGLG